MPRLRLDVALTLLVLVAEGGRGVPGDVLIFARLLETEEENL